MIDYFFRIEQLTDCLMVSIKQCLRNEEQLVSDLMARPEEKLSLPMQRSIILSCLIHQRANSVITADCTAVSSAALWVSFSPASCAPNKIFFLVFDREMVYNPLSFSPSLLPNVCVHVQLTRKGGKKNPICCLISRKPNLSQL